MKPKYTEYAPYKALESLATAAGIKIKYSNLPEGETGTDGLSYITMPETTPAFINKDAATRRLSEKITEVLNVPYPGEEDPPENQTEDILIQLALRISENKLYHVWDSMEEKPKEALGEQYDKD